MTPSELGEYVAVMRQHGVSEFTHEGLSIKLGQAPAGPETTTRHAAPTKYTNDQLLFAASEGLPETQGDE